MEDKGKPRIEGPARFRRFYQVDTKGMCLLCFRECKPSFSGSKKVPADVNGVNFSRVFLRYLNIDFYDDIVKPSKFKWKTNKVEKVGIELCQNCDYLASAFKETYSQIEILQMKLDQYTKTIWEIMRVAGKISSRVTLYQEKMKIKVTEKGKTRFKKTPKIAVLASNFRKQIMQRSAQQHKRTIRFPKVILTKQDCTTPKIQETVEPISTNNCLIHKESLLQIRNITAGYVLSFAILWILAVQGGTFHFPAVSISSKESILGKIVDEPVDDGTTCKKDEPATSSNPPKVGGDDAFTISSCGTTVLLPHQIKTDTDFVDESLMDTEGYPGEESGELIDISGNEDDNLMATIPVEVILKQEPTESHLELNDRYCMECRIQLSCRGELEKHRSLIHKWFNHVQCPVCKLMLPSYHNLKNHRKENEACALDQTSEALELQTIAKPIFPSSGGQIRGNRFCPLEGCFEVFLNPQNLELHLKVHGFFSCKFCPDKFDKAHDLALHESERHASGVHTSYKCSRCDFHVGAQYKYMLHFVGAHLNINVFSAECDICGKGFIANGRNLVAAKELHFNSHHDKQGKDLASIFKCDVADCKAYFLKKTQLGSHKTTVHLIEPELLFDCNLCGEKAPNQLTLMKHKLQAHKNLSSHEVEAKIRRRTYPPKRGKFTCDECGTQFVAKYSLLVHMKKTHPNSGCEPSGQAPMDVQQASEQQLSTNQTDS